MKVFIVGHEGPEHNYIKSVHKNYKTAFKTWDKLRLKLLQDAREGLKIDTYGSKQICTRKVENLSCNDPGKIDNYPHETPYIKEYELSE